VTAVAMTDQTTSQRMAVTVQSPANNRPPRDGSADSRDFRPAFNRPQSPAPNGQQSSGNYQNRYRSPSPAPYREQQQYRNQSPYRGPPQQFRSQPPAPRWQRGNRPLLHVGLIDDLELHHHLVTVTFSLASITTQISRMLNSHPQATTDPLSTTSFHSADVQSLVVLSVALMVATLIAITHVTVGCERPSSKCLFRSASRCSGVARWLTGRASD